MAPQDILATESGNISNMEGNSFKSPVYFGVVPFYKNDSKNLEKFSIYTQASKLSFDDQIFFIFMRIYMIELFSASHEDYHGASN